MRTQRGVQSAVIAALEAVVEVDDVQHVQQLALVLVDALDLHVEEGLLAKERRRSSASTIAASRSLVRLLDLPPAVGGSLHRRPGAGEASESWSRSATHPSPIGLGDQAAEARDCTSASQRRGVTPLVLLLNFSGHISWKSRKSPSESSREWRAATPLTEKLPTMAR